MKGQSLDSSHSLWSVFSKQFPGHCFLPEKGSKPFVSPFRPCCHCGSPHPSDPREWPGGVSALSKPCAQQSGNISCLAQELRELSLISPLGVMNIKCKKCDRRWTLCEIIQNSSSNSEDNYGLEKWNISPNETRPPFCGVPFRSHPDPAPSSQPLCAAGVLAFSSAPPSPCAHWRRHSFLPS